MKKYFYIANIIISLISVYCLSCNKGTGSQNTDPGYQYHLPVQVDDGWQTASLESVSIDEDRLTALMNNLEQIDNHNIHSILLIKDGLLVFEEYFQGERFNLGQFTGERGFDRITNHNLCSATKSFVSALIGIAIDQNSIQSIDQSIFDFFPEHADLLNSTPEKSSITIEHLLTMRSGLQWDDETYPYEDSRNDINQLFSRSDPIRYILSKDLIEAPGSFFAYRNCNTNLLGEIIRRATGSRIDDFCDEYLFGPLGINDKEWQMLRNGYVFTSGDLRLRPRDMAKFGQLFLNNGTWNNEQIVSQEWIDSSTQNQNIPWVNGPANESDGYGYQWWIWEDVYNVSYQAYFAAGWGGQFIIVCPSMNTVIVSTAGNYYTQAEITFENMLVDYILPAIS